MTEHTPGPWELSESGISIYTRNHHLIAQTGISEKDQANARLIAAAPDLYEAMMGAMQYLEETLEPCCEVGCECLLHSFRAAIEKAQGR